MTKQPDTKAKAKARRLSEALRANLKRRKDRAKRLAVKRQPAKPPKRG